MAPGDNVFEQFLSVQKQLGAHAAEIESLKLADRDTRVEVTRLGDRMDANIGALRAELKQDMERMASAHAADTMRILAELKSIGSNRDDKLAESVMAVGQALAPRRTDTFGDFVAAHWAKLGVLIGALGFALFTAGLQAGARGETPQSLFEQVQ